MIQAKRQIRPVTFQCLHGHLLLYRFKMLVSLLFLAASKAPPFQWPSSYWFRGTWKVPYTNLSNSQRESASSIV